jgi:phosphoribosylglycinamide formyltransferase-1
VSIQPKRLRVGVLVSGRGSNLQSMLDAALEPDFPASVVLVLSDREGSYAIERATAAAVAAAYVNPKDFGGRAAFDAALSSRFQDAGVELVCLAGYMRLVGAPLLDAFPNAILNIHPSLLPAFPGVDAQRQAIEHGAKVSGVTVHLVTAELDAGPIVIQRTVPVLDDDTAATLSARILLEEHRAYPEAVQMVLDGGWRVDGRRFVRSVSAASG